MNLVFRPMLVLALVLCSSKGWAESPFPISPGPVNSTWSLAQSPSVSTEPLQADATREDLELEARIRALAGRRDVASQKISKKVEVVGGATMGVGLVLGLLVGGVGCGTASSRGGSCGDEAWAAIGGGTAGIVGIGLITMTVGILNRKEAEGELEAINRELKATVEQRRERLIPVDASLRVGEENVLTLTWQF